MFGAQFNIRRGNDRRPADDPASSIYVSHRLPFFFNVLMIEAKCTSASSIPKDFARTLKNRTSNIPTINIAKVFSMNRNANTLNTIVATNQI